MDLRECQCFGFRCLRKTQKSKEVLEVGVFAESSSWEIPSVFSHGASRQQSDRQMEQSKCLLPMHVLLDGLDLQGNQCWACQPLSRHRLYVSMTIKVFVFRAVPPANPLV